MNTLFEPLRIGNLQLKNRIAKGNTDIIAIGQPFITNPDLQNDLKIIGH